MGIYAFNGRYEYTDAICLLECIDFYAFKQANGCLGGSGILF